MNNQWQIIQLIFYTMIIPHIDILLMARTYLPGYTAWKVGNGNQMGSWDVSRFNPTGSKRKAE